MRKQSPGKSERRELIKFSLPLGHFPRAVKPHHFWNEEQPPSPPGRLAESFDSLIINAYSLSEKGLGTPFQRLAASSQTLCRLPGVRRKKERCFGYGRGALSLLALAIWHLSYHLPALSDSAVDANPLDDPPDLEDPPQDSQHPRFCEDWIHVPFRHVLALQGLCLIVASFEVD